MRQFAFYGEDSPIPPDALQTRRLEARHVARGEIIWREGDPSTSFAQLRSGCAMRYQTLGDGTRHVFSLAIPGDPLSLGSLFSPTHFASVQAITDSVVCFFPRDDARALLVTPQAWTRLAEHLVGAKHGMAERMVDLGRRDARQRLARFLIETEARLRARGLSQDGVIDLPLTQKLLAQIIGVTQVHVSRVMKELQTQGILARTRGRWIVLSRKDLRRCADLRSGNG